jgi:hypothetical protein
MKRLIQLVVAMALALAVSVPSAAPTAAYSLHNAFFDDDIIDTDNDGEYDLSICFGDNTSQGVYIGRAELMEHLGLHFEFINKGDTNVAGRTYYDGFVSSGVCDDDGSSIHIHYWNGPDVGSPDPDYPIVAYVQKEGGVAITPNLRECHIYLNDHYTYSWVEPTESNKVDGVAVVTHEILHCWGLTHPSAGTIALMTVNPPFMNPNCDFFGDTQNITADDISGGKLIYDWDGHYFQPTATLDPGWSWSPSWQCRD